jgi:heat shock protein HtpX
MTVYNKISANKWRTIIIFLIFIVISIGFFYLIGNFFGDGQTYLILGIIFSLVSTWGSYFYSDKLVLFSVGAKPATKEEYFDFYTVTENIAISAGLPMPKLYVIEDRSLNAFATGRDPKHAVVCATTGLLEKMDRTELEGVIAHELSHIKNYDILLSSVVAVLVGMIALVSDWIMRNLWWSGLRRDDDQDNRNPLLAIFIVVVLILTPIIATLIQLAISRQREYLADANGVLLTRYPQGLIRALKKIEESTLPLRTANSATAHLFIANPFKKVKKSSWFVSLFNTHPPIEERIRILESM